MLRIDVSMSQRCEAAERVVAILYRRPVKIGFLTGAKIGASGGFKFIFVIAQIADMVCT